VDLITATAATAPPDPARTRPGGDLRLRHHRIVDRLGHDAAKPVTRRGAAAVTALLDLRTSESGQVGAVHLPMTVLVPRDSQPTPGHAAADRVGADPGQHGGLADPERRHKPSRYRPQIRA
jgi:hypothetical protein